MPDALLDPAALREAASSMAMEAGALLREGHGRSKRAERKGRIDLVTEYDRLSEALILERIRTRFPGHAVLAEESGVHSGARARWLIDPLDGTTNFAHDYPFFCVSIAVEVEGVLTAAAVHDPIRGELYSAAVGGGATRNGEPIRVSEAATLEDALLVTGFPYDVREHPERHLPLFGDFLVRAQGVRRDGSAALNLCYLACGRFDGFWEGSLAPWDLAAGVLIVREAGGVVSDYGGGALRLEGRQIAAANPALHPRLLEVLARHPAAWLRPAG